MHVASMLRISSHDHWWIKLSVIDGDAFEKLALLNYVQQLDDHADAGVCCEAKETHCHSYMAQSLSPWRSDFQGD